MTLLFGFNQKVVQGINLISFSIMALIIIVIHIKNKLIDVKIALQFAGLALTTTIGGALLASVISVGCLKFCFGLLLIAIAIFEAIMQIKQHKKNFKK